MEPINLSIIGAIIVTQREYFALMAEYLEQLEKKVREHGIHVHGIQFSMPNDEAEKLQWAKQQVNAVFEEPS